MFSAMRDGLFGGPLDQLRVDHYWRESAQYYVPGAQRGVVRFIHRRQHDAAMRLGHVAPSQLVLDAGAGTGLLTRRLVDAGCVVTAVDASLAMVEGLRAVTPLARHSRIDALDINEQFDVVMCIGVLNFVTDPLGAFDRLCAMTGDDGRLVVQVTELSVAGVLLWTYYRALGFSIYLFSKPWLIVRARVCGLELVGYEHPLPHDLTIAFKRVRPRD